MNGIIGNQIELSVIIPVYNVEPYLERCLDSVLNQKYCVGEIICVDDGSTDRSGEILDYYSENEPRICVIHKKNGGLVSARKEGLRRARGKYATYVDSDDWIEKEMYQDLMALIKKYDADIVTSGNIRDYGSNCVVEDEYIGAGVYEGTTLVSGVFEKLIETNCFYRSNLSIHVYNKIYKRELLTKYQSKVDDRINIGEDAACVYPCILNANRIVVSGKNYYHYCLRMDSLMGNRKRDEAERFRILFDNLKAEFALKKQEINNIMLQYELFECYERLLQQPEKMIRCREGVLLPFGKIGAKDKVIIYGAGKFGTALKQVMENIEYGNIVAWVDKTPREGVKPVSYLSEINYDKIIIAVLLADMAEEIEEELKNMGVDERKVFTVGHFLL